MGGTSDTSQIIIGHIEYLMEILRADEVLVGHDTFDGSDDEFVANAGLQFLEVTFQIGRWRDEYQCVVLLHDAVDVIIEVNLVDIEVDAGKIGGVVAEASEILDTVIATHIPANVVGVTHHNLGNSRSPRTATNDCYLTTVEHFEL